MKRKNNNLFLNSDNDEISMLAEIKTEALEGETEIDINKDIPVIPLRNMVMFPQVVMPITVGRVSTQKLVNAAFKNSQLVAVVCQKHGDIEYPEFDDLYHIGVLVKILRIFDIPGGNMTVFVQSAGPKIKLESIVQSVPYLMGRISFIPEDNNSKNNDEFIVLARNLQTNI
jgi:ATP-dependent Lon protease